MGALVVGVVLLLVIAFLCWRLSKVHHACAFHLMTTAEMCKVFEARREQSHPAYLVAARRIGDGKREGIWKQ